MNLNLERGYSNEPQSFGNQTIIDAPSSVQHLIQSSISENTKSSYERALKELEIWLENRTLTDMLLSEYLTLCYERGLAPASIAMVPAAVRFSTRLSGLESPIGVLTERTLAGIRREGLNRGRGQVTGITFTETKFLVGQIAKHGVKGIRDAALFSLMSDCMLRVSELVAVRPADLEITSDGSGRLHLPKSKTDQEGAGATLYVGAPTMERIQNWLHLIEEQTGEVDQNAQLFRSVRKGGHIQQIGLSTQAIRKNLKTYVREAGLQGRFSGHSFRVGTAQSLAQRGATLTQMQTVGRWKSPKMPASYCRNELAGRSAVATLLYSGETKNKAKTA